MFEEKIILYGKQKKHKQTISMLIQRKDFDRAEKYCLSNKDNLLTDLFEKYVDCYNEAKRDEDVEEEKIFE